jgi:hypothetical protein
MALLPHLLDLAGSLAHHWPTLHHSHVTTLSQVPPPNLVDPHQIAETADHFAKTLTPTGATHTAHPGWLDFFNSRLPKQAPCAPRDAYAHQSNDYLWPWFKQLSDASCQVMQNRP